MNDISKFHINLNYNIMNIKRLLSFLFVLWGVMGVMKAQQPYSGCWHPDYIKDWSPEKDPDAKFNRSTVKLQPRFVDNSIKANANQHPEGQVAACLTMNPMCSMTPSQGANNFIGYNPTYWQYMDLLIWWGGSAGEGIIMPPSAPVIDVAHMNGVKVLGQLFFPPNSFGGQQKWVEQILSKDGDSYPYARKMYEIAAYYGFDGWFINKETSGGSLAEWTDWIAYFNQCAKENGHSEMEIQWYDCNDVVGYNGPMMKLHNTSYFLNYGSARENNVPEQMQVIQDLGFTKEQAFKKLYFGIEVAANGLDGNQYSYNVLFPRKGHAGSIDLFNPEEQTWKKVVKNYLDTENACGEKAYAAMETVFKNESRFWTNEQNNPADTTARSGEYFPGIANAILERSVIQSLPFVTSFSAGLGKYRFVEGEKKGTQDWYHRGMQDILPTWRWWVEAPIGNQKDLSFSYNWDDAYNVGTSLKVRGRLQANTDYLTRLYKTKLQINNNDQFQLVFKGGSADNIQLKLGILENNNDFTSFDLTATTSHNGWTIANVDLSSLAGKTVSVVALNFKSQVENPSFETLLGQLSIMNTAYSPVKTPVSNLSVENQLQFDGGDLRVVWDTPAPDDMHHYNIYLTRNGITTLVGQTRNQGFYIPKFKRTSLEEISVQVAVAAVTKDLKEGEKAQIEVNYTELQKPEVTVKALKTLCSVNDVVRFVATASNMPESYTWSIPEGVEKVGEADNYIELKFKKEGKYGIQVAVSNRIGTTTVIKENLVEVSNDKSGKLKLVSVDKEIHSVSGALAPEVPENIIDGIPVPGDIRAKWCTGGSKEHWVIVDLLNPYELYKTKIYDCGNKENYKDNFKNYKIFVSKDAQDWTLVVDEKDRPENRKEDYFTPIIGRYVKLVPYDQNTPITIRVWEFEIYGIEGGPIINAPKEILLNVQEPKSIEIPYQLEENEDVNFELNLLNYDREYLEIADINCDKEKNIISFNITALKMGTTQFSLTLRNGDWLKESVINVKVDDPSFSTNILQNKTVLKAQFLYRGSTWRDINEVEKMIDGDHSSLVFFKSFENSENVRIILDSEDLYDVGQFKFKLGKIPAKIKIYAAEKNIESDFKLIEEHTPTNSEPAIVTSIKNCRYFKINMQANPEPFQIFEIMAYGKKPETVNIEQAQAEDFRIYPNPIRKGNSLKIEAPKGSFIQLMSLQGTVIKKMEMTSQSEEISMDDVLAGTYVVVITGKEHQQTLKVIVE